MEIMLISYGDIGFDGRLRSLISVFSQIGRVHSITRGSVPPNEISKVCNTSYSKFVSEAICFAKNIKKIDWLVLDNRKATIPGLIIQKKYHPTIVIQDCRELYLINEVKHFTGKVGCIFEKMMVKKANIVICANQDRAKIMQREYELQREPLTYENLRQLKYDSMEGMEFAKKRIDHFIHDGEYRIVSSSGCSVKRTNDILVQNLSKVEKPCRLFLIGESETKDVETVKGIINEKHLSNVEILGRLNQNELKYLISQSHIGVVNYGQYDTNNRLCASGKLYEFLYEGIPVVTTTNPPLKTICDKYGIGIADDSYSDGINKIINSYTDYKKRVEQYVRNNGINENDSKLIADIKNSIE